jgi:hypothetical protein
MAYLKSSQISLATDMEQISIELSTWLQPEPEEIILQVLQFTLQQCYKVCKVLFLFI